MKKFYFLNKRKQWQGPYLLPQIILFCLNGDISPMSYLWHNKLTSNIGEHPNKSIYKRKKAYEFRFLPKWIFRSNLKILTLNIFKKFKRKFKNKNSWEVFSAKPIEIPKIVEEAKEIYLIPSIAAIHDFINPEDFQVKLIYVERNDDQAVVTAQYPIRLFSDTNPGIRFEITMKEPPSVGGVEHKESYGLHRQLTLISENESIEIATDSVFDFSTRFPYKPQLLKGRFKQANLITESNYRNEYNRLIIEIEDDKFISPQEIVSSPERHLYDYDAFNVHPSPMGMSFKTGDGYIDLQISGVRYRLYGVSEAKLIVIDAMDIEDFLIFKQKAEIIRIVLAIMTGKFYGGICNYITSSDIKFTHIQGIWYEIEKETVISNRRVIDLHTFRSTFKEEDQDYNKIYKDINKPVSSEVLSNLCNALFGNKELLHAAKLIISGMGNTDPLQQGALYSVALETLTSVLGEAKSGELKPIPQRPISRQLVADLKEVLTKYQQQISEEGLTILEKKIDAINTPTNKDKLIKTFELYGVKLSDEDQKTINKRNDYLHGRAPLDFEQTFELTQISLRLHTLLVALLLKSVGYTGHIINLDIQAFVTDETRFLELFSVFQKKQEELSQLFKQAVEEKEFTNAKTIVEQIREHLKNNKLSDLIRIL